MELSTFPYQSSRNRTVRENITVADEGSYVSYLEGCTAPSRDENQLHAAVVELVALMEPK
jgi:Fe-S cluster assembly protein SufB